MESDSQPTVPSHRSHALEATGLYHVEREPRPFIPGRTHIPAGGPLFDVADRKALVAAALDMRIGAGEITSQFEREFARTLAAATASLVNSGSSANLLAVAALVSESVPDNRLRPGAEVITLATGFSTTVNPILQMGLVPVFMDIDPRTLAPRLECIESAIDTKTQAIMIAHTLGNPFPVAEVAQLAAAHGLWLIEDNCDALGSTYRGRLTGTFGHLSTSSFYPAHHVTMGEGGCVVTSDMHLAKIVRSLRDWGRDCWCPPGEDNACGKRFSYCFDGLPDFYDHKSVFSEIGYNLKSTDINAALGLSQLAKIQQFTRKRQENWRRLSEGLSDTPYLSIVEPTPGSEPSWFGCAMHITVDAPFSRHQITSYLEDRMIATRPIFAGNITKQPAYRHKRFRVFGDLSASDMVTAQSFWIGVQPSITDEMLEYMIHTIRTFCYSGGLA